MTERIEYAWIDFDADGRPIVERTEWKGERLRTAPAEIYPAETVSVERPYTHRDGRTGTLRGTVALAARIDPPEVKIGADGKPAARPIVTAERPSPHPWQQLVGPLYDIGPDTVTRYWDVEDRPLDQVKAIRTDALRNATQRALLDALAEGDDLTAVRQAARAAGERLAAATTARAAHDVELFPTIPDAAEAKG